MSRSSKKSHRVTVRKEARNKPARTFARGRVRAARTKIAEPASPPESEQRVKEAVSALAKAAQKGVIHRNNAARRISRIMRSANKAAAA